MSDLTHDHCSWHEFVKKFAQERGLTYGQAIYKAVEPWKEHKEMMMMMQRCSKTTKRAQSVKEKEDMLVQDAIRRSLFKERMVEGMEEEINS